MTDGQNTDQGATGQGAGQQQQPPLSIAGQYIKDLSFEAPNSPQIFQELENQPNIDISVDVQTRPLGNNAHETSLHFTVNGTFGGKTGFVLEIAYGAVAILNVPAEHVQGVLNVDVPRFMFPAVRNIVSDVTRDSGFPALLMQPIDFMQIYQGRLQAAQKQQQEQAADGGDKKAE